MTAGAAMLSTVRRAGLSPATLAWDFASIALAAVTADFAESRSTSPDGWTREFEVQVPVSDPDRWSSQANRLKHALSFLTTDRWSFTFTSGSVPFAKPRGKRLQIPGADCVALLSGGLDSLVGGIDLVEAGRVPYFVSHTVPRDRVNQKAFAARLDRRGSESKSQREHPPSQGTFAARPLVFFIAYGILVATSLDAYGDGEAIDLFLNETATSPIDPRL